MIGDADMPPIAPILEIVIVPSFRSAGLITPLRAASVNRVTS